MKRIHVTRILNDEELKKALEFGILTVYQYESDHRKLIGLLLSEGDNYNMIVLCPTKVEGYKILNMHKGFSIVEDAIKSINHQFLWYTEGLGREALYKFQNINPAENVRQQQGKAPKEEKIKHMSKSSIGIRANPNEIIYCVLNGEFDEFEITQIDKIVNPKALEIPEQLKFIRSTLCDIINENNVRFACIRIAESNARRINIPRIYLEGVIQELIASSTVENYYIGQISSISARLGIDRSDFKPFVSGELIYQDIEIWNDLNSEEKESLLAAVSALNL